VPWKFPDPPDTGVFTTRQVFDDGVLLSLVSHDADGDWQFLHDERATRASCATKATSSSSSSGTSSTVSLR
jgi:hypothetical protein